MAGAVSSGCRMIPYCGLFLTLRGSSEPASFRRMPRAAAAPRGLEGEICTILPHPVVFVAGSVGGPVQFCNVRCVLLCHRSDTAWQSRTGGRMVRLAVSSLPSGTHKGCRAPTRDAPTVLTRWGQGFRAAGSVPRMSDDSTDVRVFQGGRQEFGIGADWWGEMAQMGSIGGMRVGRAHSRVGAREAQQSDAFSGCGGADEGSRSTQ